MIENVKKLLEREHNKCLEKVKDSKYYANFTHEKLLHSMQVFGLGKYIYKHQFAGKPEYFKDLAMKAVLLHDVGRFTEIEGVYKSDGKQRFDHGVLGYEILKNMPDYNDVRITLPVKHHGHMIEEFYNDAEYKNILDEKIKKEAEDIIFLVRDADKMANLFFFLRGEKLEDKMFFKLNLANKTEEQMSFGITPNVLEEFLAGKIIQNKNVISGADEVIRFLAWLYDVNYKSSYDYFNKHNLLPKYMEFLTLCSNDEKLHIIIENKIKNHITKRS